MCSLVTMVTYFPCMTAFSPLKVHGQTFGILHFDTLLCIFNQLINSWQFHLYHIRYLSSVIQINSTVDLYGNVLTCCEIFLAQNKLSSVTNETYKTFMSNAKIITQHPCIAKSITIKFNRILFWNLLILVADLSFYCNKSL